MIVVEEGGDVVTFAATSEYSSRGCYTGVAEFSAHADRGARGRGAVGMTMAVLILAAEQAGFWKLLSRIFCPDFLDAAGDWDQTLVFVIVGALLVAVPAYRFVPRRGRPVLEEKFSLPQKEGDRRAPARGLGSLRRRLGHRGVLPRPGDSRARHRPPPRLRVRGGDARRHGHSRQAKGILNAPRASSGYRPPDTHTGQAAGADFASGGVNRPPRVPASASLVLLELGASVCWSEPF